MKITMTNLGTKPVSMPGTGINVAAGETKSALGQSRAVAAQALALASRIVLVRCDLDAADREPVVAVQTSTANPAGGATTVPAIGFTLTSTGGVAVANTPAIRMGVGAFDDIDGKIPSNATLNTATKGVIVAGAGTNRLDVTVDAADGQFRCTLTIPVAGSRTVYVKTFLLPQTDRVVDTSGSDASVFTP